MFFENVKFRDVLIKPIPRRLCTVSKQRNADDRANREHNVDISCNFTLCIKLNRLQDIVSGSERYDTLCDQNNRLRMKKKQLSHCLYHQHYTRTYTCLALLVEFHHKEHSTHNVLFDGNQPTTWKSRNTSQELWKRKISS